MVYRVDWVSWFLAGRECKSSTDGGDAHVALMVRVSAFDNFP